MHTHQDNLRPPVPICKSDSYSSFNNDSAGWRNSKTAITGIGTRIGEMTESRVKRPRFPFNRLACLVALVLLLPLMLRAQTIQLNFYGHFSFYAVNVDTNVTLTLALADISQTYTIFIPSNTAVIFETPILTTEVEVQKDYHMSLTGEHWDIEAVGATYVGFLDLPDCTGLSIDGPDFGNEDAPKHTAYCDDSNDECSWTIQAHTNTATIFFDPLCGSGLPADGFSTTTAWASNSTLIPPLEWEIEAPDLGCKIDSTNGVITAGTNFGTITVRLYGSNHQCYAQANLDLIDPDEGCSTCDPGGGGGEGGGPHIGQGGIIVGSVDVRLNMGRSAYGASARSLRLFTEYPTNRLYTPAALQYPWRRKDVDVVHDGDGNISQVKGPEGLASVLIMDDHTFYLLFYLPSQIGLRSASQPYPIFDNDPFTSWLITNPSPGTSNRLSIFEWPENGEESHVYDYVWVTNGWRLTNAGGLQIVTKTNSWTTNGFDIFRTETKTMQEGSSSPVSVRTKRFDAAGRVVEETFGSGPTAKTNSYTFNSDGTLQKAVRADGSWEWSLLDSRKRATNRFSAFMNQGATTNGSICRLTDMSYDTNTVSGSGDIGSINPAAPRRTIDYVRDHEVGRNYQVFLPGESRLIQCQTAGAAWNASDNLVTTTKTYTEGANFGKVKSVLYPDGTIQIYQYLTADYSGAGSHSLENMTNVVLTGQPNGYNTDVLDGSKTITVIGPVGEKVSRTVIDIASGITNLSEIYSDYDDYHRPRKVAFLDGTFTYADYTCCGQQTLTNREGTVTSFYYDSLKRLSATTSADFTTNSITISNLWDAAGNLLGTVRKGSDDTLMTLKTTSFDTAGRTLTSTNAVGNATTYGESLAPIIRTNIYPNASTRIDFFALDGALLQSSGSAVHGIRYTNDVETESGVYRLFSQETRLDSSGNATSESTKRYFDMLGRTYMTVYSDGSLVQTIYNTNGQIIRQVDPDNMTTLYQYNARGELEYTATDMNTNNTIDFAGPDRITRTVTIVTTNNGYRVRQTKTFVWPTIGTNSSTLIGVDETTVDGLFTWNSRYGVTNQTTISYGGSGFRSVASGTWNAPYSVRNYQDGRLISDYRYFPEGPQMWGTDYGYDAHGRQVRAADVRRGTTTNTFDNADRITQTATPAPASGQPSQVTATYYNNMGWVTNVVLPDGGSVRTTYWLTGEVATNSGARTYPVGYSYDYAGRMKTLTTWTDFASGSGAAVTTWNYDGYRGFMTNKVYADGKGPGYTYTAAGRLKTRTWARGIVTTNGYSAAGDLSITAYSDGTTPSLARTFDRRGRETTITQRGTNVTTLALNDAGQITGESYSGGLLSGLAVTNIYNAMLYRTINGVVDSNGVFLTWSSNYVNTGARLRQVFDGSNYVTYSYLANSPLVSQIIFSNSAERMVTRKAYDNLNRLTWISSSNSTLNVFSSFAYAYNSANQRTGVTNADGSRWACQYDGLGQVISGKRYWSDGTIVAGQQFEYGFDDIGNRKFAGSGGDQWGANLRYEQDTANNLNQYSQRTIPGAVDILGAANSNATLTVNNRATYRNGDYYRNEYGVDNRSGAVYPGLTNLAVLPNGTNADITVTNIGNVFVAKTPEVFSYDADGNLTNNGRWVFTWDAENRLIQLESQTSAPIASKRKATYTYDSRGRQVGFTVYNGSTGSYVVTNDLRFLSDGWRFIAELSGTNNVLVRSYIWGVDLSGSFTGGAGVGGLLEIKSLASGLHFYGNDGNGNVTRLVSGVDGNSTAAYEYDPFGQTIRASGTMSAANPFRFSSKYQDEETDFIMYPYRPYSSSTGRFLRKDTLEEAGGINLYACSGNDLMDFVDPLGLYTPIWQGTTVGVKNSGGRLGGHRLGATAVSLSINKLKPSVKNCQCCLDELDLKMTLQAYVMAIGDTFTFGWPGGWDVTVDSEIQNHTIAHEQVHVNVTWKGFGKLFPKIESDCTGKCFSKPWFSSFTPASCRAKWESLIYDEMKWVGDRIDKLNKRWDAYDPESVFRGDIADTAPFYKEVDASLDEWSRHKFCAPGFFSGDPH